MECLEIPSADEMYRKKTLKTRLFRAKMIFLADFFPLTGDYPPVDTRKTAFAPSIRPA